MTNTVMKSEPANGGRVDRRTILRGAGLAMGLPLLEAMTPLARSAYAAAESKSPVRLACIFFPNGVIMPDWKPQGQGENWKLSKTLAPLEPLKSKLNVISNLAHDNGRGYADGAGDHARCAASYLTASRPVKTSSNIRIGVSLDQIAASQLSAQTRLPSIELGLESSRNAGSCDSGYSCAYSSNISWRNETQPMPKEVTPRMAFERMFGGADMRRPQATELHSPEYFGRGPGRCPPLDETRGTNGQTKTRRVLYERAGDRNADRAS